MRQLQPVLWSKGVLLSPQHLQIQDRFLEDLLEFRLDSLTFRPWGFRRLEIDRESLAGGAFALTGAAGIFPDGLLFDVPASDPAPAPRPLEDHWRPDQESMLVHLSIPEHRIGGHNVSTTRRDGATRYAAEVVLRRDENTGLMEKPVQVARKNLRILVEGESLEGHSTLPVARVARSSSGDYRIDPGFVPPLLDIGASETVTGIVRGLVEVLTARSSALAGARRQRNRGLADFGVSDVANFWLLYTVNTWLPLFLHLHGTRRGHPAQLFSAMAGLAGALTTFSDRIHPRELPEYDHQDLGPRLTELDRVLRELLETVVPANHVSLPLSRTEASVYATAIDRDTYFGAPRMYLAVSADTGPAELLKAPQLMKVSSADQIERLIKQALPGVGLTHVPEPPGSLPVKLDYEYFSLDRSGPAWDAIRRARNLAVYVPSDFPDPRLELVVVLPRER